MGEFDDDMSMPETEGIWQNILTPEQIKRMLSSPSGPAGKRRDTRENRGPRAQQAPQGNAQMMNLMARMILRREDHLSTLLSDVQFLIHMGVHQDGILPALLATSQQWHSNEKTCSLRHTLAVKTMEIVLDRLKQLQAADPQSDLYKSCLNQRIITQDRTMPYLQWNATTNQLTPSKTAPLPLDQVLKDIQMLLTHMADPRVTLRFHSRKWTTRCRRGKRSPSHGCGRFPAPQGSPSSRS